MENPAVNWSEGMFLCPQHFQASDRYWQEVTTRGERLDHAYNYGVRKLTWSPEALATGHIAISECQARLKDGTLAVVTPAEELRADLVADRTAGPSLFKALDQQETVRVLLAAAAPTASPDNVVTADSPSAGKARFIRFERPTVDDTSGDNSLPVAHRRLNLRILLSTDDHAGYQLLPLLQVRRNAATGQPELDPDYFPPSLALEAWPPLGLEIVRRIFDFISGRADVLADQIVDRRVSFSSHEAGDLDRMLLLSALNEAIGTLTCLSFAEGVHPFVGYRALCEIVGRLSIFGAGRRVTEIPRYDHDDLARIFQWAYRAIEGLIYDPGRETFEQRFFVGQGLGLQAALETKWFDESWDWYVGARPLNFKPEQCRTLLTRGRIDWKLGSSDEVDAMYTGKKPGVELAALDQPPRVLPASEGWTFFKVNRETSAWRQLRTTRIMAIRLNPKLIREHDKLQGNRRLDMVMEGDFLSMEFAVFAVPKPT